MELRQLEYVVAVADEGSFTRAAKRCRVAQPGISAQVRRLERELGLMLFDRSSRAIRPTDAGAVVLVHARAALAAVGAIRPAVAELKGLLSGQVRVGVVSTLDVLELPALLAGFSRRHPGVELVLYEGRADVLFADLASGHAHLVFAGMVGRPPTGVEATVIVDVPLVALVAPDHPIAGRTGVPLVVLAAHPLIATPAGSGLRQVLEDALAAVGARPHIGLEASDPEALANLAAEGLGAAIIPEPVAAGHPELRAVKISRPGLRGRLAMAWRADAPTSPAAAAFLAHARTAFPGPLA